jgi:hypothetical protein
MSNKIRVRELIELLQSKTDPDDFVAIETLEPIGTAIDVSRIALFDVRRDVSDMEFRAILVPEDGLTELL